MPFLDIGEVAARSGVPPSALRYYEEVGLISAVARRGLRRQFDPAILTQLALIAMGRTAGFSLEEIREMFDKDGRAHISRDELERRADALDEQIRKLADMSSLLRHVAACPAPNHLECPKFQQLMRLALRRNKRRSS